MKLPKSLLAMLLVTLACAVGSCGDGCVTCSGITVDRKVCKDDFQEDKDYTAYIREYELQGGICEE